MTEQVCTMFSDMVMKMIYTDSDDVCSPVGCLPEVAGIDILRDTLSSRANVRIMYTTYFSA